MCLGGRRLSSVKGDRRCLMPVSAVLAFVACDLEGFRACDGAGAATGRYQDLVVSVRSLRTFY